MQSDETIRRKEEKEAGDHMRERKNEFCSSPCFLRSVHLLQCLSFLCHSCGIYESLLSDCSFCVKDFWWWASAYLILSCFSPILDPLRMWCRRITNNKKETKRRIEERWWGSGVVVLWVASSSSWWRWKEEEEERMREFELVFGSGSFLTPDIWYSFYTWTIIICFYTLPILFLSPLYPLLRLSNLRIKKSNHHSPPKIHFLLLFWHLQTKYRHHHSHVA